MIKCIGCNETLTGLQKKYCSEYCKNNINNHKFQAYKLQRVRGLERRQKLINDKGGCCQKCGYKRNLSALTFHHREPKKKKFILDIRRCSNASLESLIKEAKKCDLLCANCHIEIHHPRFNIS